MQDTTWRLVHDAVIPYGKAGLDTVVHARAYEATPTDTPIVLLSEFGDHRGRPLSQAIAEAAAAAQAALYRRGDDLRFVQHTPHGQRFHEVRFHQRRRTTVFYHRGAPPARRGRSVLWSTSATPVTVRGVRRHIFQPPQWAQDLPWTFHDPHWTELATTPPRRRGDPPGPLGAPDGAARPRPARRHPRPGLARRPLPAVPDRRRHGPQDRRRPQRRPHAGHPTGGRGAVLAAAGRTARRPVSSGCRCSWSPSEQARREG